MTFFNDVILYIYMCNNFLLLLLCYVGKYNYFESLLITRMSAAFSSFRRKLSCLRISTCLKEEDQQQQND